MVMGTGVDVSTQVSEVVTVSSQTSIVDTQSASQETVINREALTQLPIARDWFSVAALVPQMVTTGTQDIGGLTGTRAIVMNFSDNGGRGTEGRLQVDGLSTGGNRTNGTGSGVFLPDITNAQEVIIIASGGLGCRTACCRGVPFEQRMLGFGVERGGRLVENQNQRVIAHEAACQRELLPLAERHLHASRPRRTKLRLQA